MGRIQDDQTTGGAEHLVSELKAIELWDAVYKRNLFPLWYDHIAFVSRQKRRAEIVSELERMRDGNVYASNPMSGTEVSQGEWKTPFERQNGAASVPKHDRYRK
jgi:hypothetical protein